MAKELVLSRGEITIVDDEDYDFLSQFKWCCHHGYAISRSKKLNSKTKYTYMHRLINKTPNELITDHVNGNKLDNRKCNLRSVTVQQNAMNKNKTRKRTSEYKGVYWDPINKKWTSRIYVNGKPKQIGGFKDEKDAANAYNIFAVKYFGEYAKLNDVPFNEDWESTRYYKSTGKTSKYRGVHFHKASRKWVANLRVNGKKKHLGLFNNEKDAAIAYNNAVKKYLNKPGLSNVV